MKRPSPSPAAKRWRRSLRWGAGAALLALTPKCLLCAAAYLGLGAVLGVTGPELCGASPASGPSWLIPAVIAALLAAATYRWWPHRRGPDEGDNAAPTSEKAETLTY